MIQNLIRQLINLHLKIAKKEKTLGLEHDNESEEKWGSVDDKFWFFTAF